MFGPIIEILNHRSVAAPARARSFSFLNNARAHFALGRLWLGRKQAFEPTRRISHYEARLLAFLHPSFLPSLIPPGNFFLLFLLPRAGVKENWPWWILRDGPDNRTPARFSFFSTGAKTFWFERESWRISSFSVARAQATCEDFHHHQHRERACEEFSIDGIYRLTRGVIGMCCLTPAHSPDPTADSCLIVWLLLKFRSVFRKNYLQLGFWMKNSTDWLRICLTAPPFFIAFG